MTRYRDITSGKVDLARLAEQRDGYLGLDSFRDPRLDPEPAVQHRATAPVTGADFDPAGPR